MHTSARPLPAEGLKPLFPRLRQLQEHLKLGASVTSRSSRNRGRMLPLLAQRRHQVRVPHPSRRILPAHPLTLTTFARRYLSSLASSLDRITSYVPAHARRQMHSHLKRNLGVDPDRPTDHPHLPHRPSRIAARPLRFRPGELLRWAVEGPTALGASRRECCGECQQF